MSVEMDYKSLFLLLCHITYSNCIENSKTYVNVSIRDKCWNILVKFDSIFLFVNFRPFCKASDWFGSFLSGEPYAWVIDQAEIKMAGYWPNSFFACKLMDQEEVKVHKLTKKERGQHPAILTRQVWWIKDLLYGFLGNFPCGIQRVVASRQDSSTLHTRVANHRA